LNEHAMTVLEFPVLLKYLTQFTDSVPTKERILQLRPMTRYRDIRDAFEEISECIELVREKDLRTITLSEGLEESIKNATVQGWMLIPQKIADIGSLIHQSEIVKKTICTHESGHRLKAMVEVIKSESELYRSIERAIGDEGEILDHASAELAAVRRKIRKHQDSIRSRMQSIAQEMHKRGFLQDPIVTMRNDRYVLPVKAEQTKGVPGIMHDRSASGVTAFIEPQSIVSINNTLMDLRTAERREIQRILKDLTQRIGSHADNLLYMYQTILEIDFILAKSLFAEEIQGHPVQLTQEARLEVYSCRNPLLVMHKLFSDFQLGDTSPVIPIEFHIGDQKRTLIITGPNTGGKTVVLKSIGLTLLMVQTGLYPTCSPDSTIGMFSEIFADIGDEQSLEQSLSTFSAHLKQIVPILDQADKSSLVLLDELGAGTDPTEGSALGIAILSELLERQVTTVATTHHNSIKAFAFTTEGIANAAMEFDNQSLKPTYRILMGQVGQSNALSIAARLGIPKRILVNAGKHLEGKPADLEKMLKIIEKEKQSAIRLRAKADAEANRARELRRAREDVLKKAQNDAREIMDRARNEAADILDEMTMEEKKLRQAAVSLRKARESIQDNPDTERTEPAIDFTVTARLKQKIKREQPVESRITASSWAGRVPSPGDTVWVESMDKEAKVIRLTGLNSVTVEINGKRIKLPLSQVSPAVKPDADSDGKSVEVLFEDGECLQDEISMRLNLIGKTADEAVDALDVYLDKAYRAGFPLVTIIHGFGTGKLQSTVVQCLKQNPLVSSVRRGNNAEGGGGVTIAEMERKR
jgi:DNA mismatch repair protein MutS2